MPTDEASTLNRPDYIACIGHTNAPTDGPTRTWCGRTCYMEWVFLGIDHAVYSVHKETRMVPCPECVAAILAVLSPPTPPEGRDAN